jgi:hypothetical protein
LLSTFSGAACRPPRNWRLYDYQRRTVPAFPGTVDHRHGDGTVRATTITAASLSDHRQSRYWPKGGMPHRLTFANPPQVSFHENRSEREGLMAEKEAVETSEAQIAVHWQEEDLLLSVTAVHRPGQHDGQGIYERFSLDNFPNCFKEYADLLDLVQVLG